MADLPAFLRVNRDGCTINVKVHPRARRCGVVGPHGDVLKLEVTAPPVGGAANREVEKLLAELLGIACDRVTVGHGAGSRRKVVVIQGVGPERVAEALGIPGR